MRFKYSNALYKHLQQGIMVLKKYVLPILFVLFLSLPVAAQTDSGIFKRYPTSEKYKGKNASLKLTKGSKTFRTQLRKAGKKKPNFARHYIIALWGCGLECVMGAVIDANTGDVFQIPFTLCCWGFNGEVDFKPVDFRSDSKLIIFTGARDEKDGDSEKHYYLFENNRFIELSPEEASEFRE